MSSLKDEAPKPTRLSDLRAADPSALRVLITLRSATRALAGHWELPGGKIEGDESAAQAVVRELREEVGIEVLPIAALASVDHVYEHAHVRLLPLICCRAHGRPQAIEVDDARWVGLHELASFRFPDASLPVIDALIDAIG